jgi:hypothetical protein
MKKTCQLGNFSAEEIKTTIHFHFGGMMMTGSQKIAK